MILNKTLNSNKKKLSSQLDLKTKKNYKINRKDNDVNKGVKFLFLETNGLLISSWNILSSNQ